MDICPTTHHDLCFLYMDKEERWLYFQMQNSTLQFQTSLEISFQEYHLFIYPFPSSSLAFPLPDAQLS